MKIGEAHGTQSSSLQSANTIGAPMPPAPIVMADRTREKIHWRTVPGQHCLLAEGHIVAPIYWRTEHKKCTEMLGFWLLSREGEATNGSFGAFFMPYEKNKKRRTEQFGSLRLFSSQSPINLALQTGNGNTLKKRRRSHKKFNRHRSPRSETIF